MRVKPVDGVRAGGHFQRRRHEKARARARQSLPPKGAMALPLERLLQRASRKRREAYNALSVQGKEAEAISALLTGSGQQPHVQAINRTAAAYAGGAVINALPRSKAHHRPR